MRSTRALVLAVILAAVVSVPSAARADGVGLGLFIGRPFGLDLKLDLQRRSALDIVLGFSTIQDNRADYGHLTYLVTPIVAEGQSVRVPIRLGIGVAVYDDGVRFGQTVDVAVRAPLEVGFRLRSAPVEIYGEIALVVPFVRHVDALLDGGIGFRIYF